MKYTSHFTDGGRLIRAGPRVASTHLKVWDLGIPDRPEGAICVCLDCMQAWTEGGDCGVCPKGPK